MPSRVRTQAEDFLRGLEEEEALSQQQREGDGHEVDDQLQTQLAQLQTKVWCG